MKTVIEILTQSEFVDLSEYGLNNIHPEALIDLIENLPLVEDEDGNQECIDFENFEVISIKPDKMVVCAGGDWQEPLTFTLVVNGDKLKATDIVAGYKDGLNLDKIESLLYL